MKVKRQRSGIVFRIFRVAGLAFVLLFAFVFVDFLPSLWNDISPPSGLATIEEFRAWKGDRSKSEGVFESGGETYTVLTGEISAFLASGPSAYVFDSSGAFVDWTRDMRDAPTKKHGFDLTSGNVEFRKKEAP